MLLYLSPMVGITGYIVRNAYAHFFPYIDKYFTPFIVPTKNYCFTSKELNDIKPEHNKNIKVIPQILTNNADYFLSTTEKLNEFGYDEINLNLGCPSGTVVSKFKGSGFLAKREELDMFKLLLSINGVGAKAALSLLSISRVTNLKYAIMMGDEKHICRAPGIGKKTAGRIILELQDKLKKEDMVIDKEQMDMDNDFNEDNNYASTLSEVMGALLALGYSEKEAELALKKVNKNDTVDNVIKECLKVLMG